MATIFNNLGRFFRQKDILTRLIIINVLVFALVRLTGVFLTLFKIDATAFMACFQLPGSLLSLAKEPWTLITYMFSHHGLLHILFNMLWLYWFGKIFLIFFNTKQLLGTYLLGGIAGACLFLLSFNIFPYFEDAVESSRLLGASAAVMAIVFAASFYKKDFRISLLFLGNIKIYYVALVSLALDLLAITSENAGGHIAHIGGALFGICYALAYRRGTDLTKYLNKFLDKCVNLFKRKPKMKVTFNRRASDYQYNDRKKQENEAIDQILDKIKKSGYNSLSKDEKKRLFDASK
ncbi:MAG: rhomboid family intramembrane serine protease [Dysgonamonadaceae bacterium]|jgi:membrane associated rhomboid family serine protease|nr:rhomboid family intramembrane serine protease [Dysgonamonadaceae bacterium]